MKRRLPISVLLMLLLVLLLALGWTAVSLYKAVQREAVLQAYLYVSPEETVETIPEETEAPRQLQLTQAELAAAAAEAGGAVMTNADLQIYFMDQVSAWRAGEHDLSPDFSRPLADQPCPLREGMSWEQYFLTAAVDAWHTQQALIHRAAQPQSLDDPDYQPIDYLHEEYLAADLPLFGFLYGIEKSYTPNSVHQAWLDALPETIETKARELGYAGADAYAAAVYGEGVTGADVLRAAENANLAYMYFTELSYALEPGDREVAAYLKAESAAYPEKTRSFADIRHCLLIPQGAQVAQDGTVTADEAAWDACRAYAEQLLAEWKTDRHTVEDADASFGRMANQYSEDAGTAVDGGLYVCIPQGALPAQIDRWAFSPERIEGDTVVLRTDRGIHMLYLRAFRSRYTETARQLLLSRRLEPKLEEMRAEIPVTVHPDTAAVRFDPEVRCIRAEELLYPDVGHERFTEAITFLQQDFQYHSYGSSTVGRGGCGITTMAMLATYMTDRIYTPAWLADKYYYYHDNSGTDGEIFRIVPSELGFYMDFVEYDLDRSIDALKNGQVVISLQQLGHFTRGGHYLLLQRYYEENDTFQIRDSNIYNYKRLSGHAIDRFTRANLLSGMSHNYVMQKKLLRVPACGRCGDVFPQTYPEGFLNTEYTCEKCRTALARRNSWLALTGSL